MDITIESDLLVGSLLVGNSLISFNVTKGVDKPNLKPPKKLYNRANFLRQPRYIKKCNRSYYNDKRFFKRLVVL